MFGCKRFLDFTHALLLLCDMEDDRGAISAKLAEIVDRSLHCPHVQVRMVAATAEPKQTPVSCIHHLPAPPLMHCR